MEPVRLSLSVTSIKRKFLLINLFVLATAFSPFIGAGGRNYLLIGLIILVISIFSIQIIKINKKNWAIYFLPITLLITGLIHYSQFRTSSYLYGLMFILFFVVNLYLIRNSSLTLSQFQIFLKTLIYSFFYMLIIQQIMYLAGIENFPNKIFADGFRFNSLATEPSHAAIIIVFSFYSYIRNKEIINKRVYYKQDLKQDYLLWGKFLYIMLTIGSSYGILLVLLFLGSFVKNKKFFIVIIFLFVIAFFAFLKYNYVPFLRLNTVLKSLFDGGNDFSRIVQADHSASIRIIPILYLLTYPSFITLFGRGMDFSANLFPTIIPGIEEGTMGGGLFPSFLIDNGIVNFILLVFIIYNKSIQKIFSFSFIALLFTLLNTSFNSQLFWFVITLLAINKYLYIQNQKLIS